MQEEERYLKKTIELIGSNIADNLIEISKEQKKIDKTNEEISLNWLELEKVDLSRHKVDIEDSRRVIEYLKRNNKRLERQLGKPYFARIDFATENGTQKIYIGLGLVKDGNIPAVYDWRSPIASMYYDYDIGKAEYSCEDGIYEGEITLKRQYAIEDQKIKYFIDTSETINDEILQEVLSRNTSSKMKEIVATIQKEQNKLIRTESKRNILVQGVAGSGKTSVALHRAGYLLYKNKELTNEDIFILSPSSLFSEYISEVLPELGEENVLQGTFLNIAKAELNQKIHTREVLIDDLVSKKDNKTLASIAYKASFGFLEDLLDFLKNTFSKTFRPRTLSFATKEGEDPLFVFTQQEMEKLYYETYKDLEIYKRISYMSEYLIERFNLKKKEFLPIKERFSKMLYNFFPTTDFNKILSLFLLTKGIEEEKGNVCEYEDLAALLIIKEYVYGISIDSKVKYLIIDEMQDFTPAHFYIFNKLWNCPKLVLGDINQCLEKKLTKEYLHMLADYLQADLVELNKTYRSTREISIFCQNMIGLTDVVNANRSGEEPEIIKTKNQIGEIQNCIINNKERFKHIAVVCKTTAEAQQVYQELSQNFKIQLLTGRESQIEDKVIITTSAYAKGIEFDYVIIPYCDKDNYKDSLDQNLLYVAGTRALHKLTLIYSEEISPIIKTNIK